MATGFGLQLVRTLHGNAPLQKEFYVPSTDSTALFVGDVVKLVATTGAMDPLNEVPAITRAATGEILLGVVTGFRTDDSLVYTGNSRAASTNRYVQVCIDPDAVYQAQEDAVGGSVTAALVGAMANVNMVVAAGSTATGLSGTMVDSSTTTASAADLKIVGVKQDAQNQAAQSGGAVLEVMILAPAIKSTDSQS